MNINQSMILDFFCIASNRFLEISRDEAFCPFLGANTAEHDWIQNIGTYPGLEKIKLSSYEESEERAVISRDLYKIDLVSNPDTLKASSNPSIFFRSFNIGIADAAPREVVVGFTFKMPDGKDVVIHGDGPCNFS